MKACCDAVQKPERKQRTWWALADGTVSEVTGYDCLPHNPKMWWCPEAGYSLTEGHHLFETEADALQVAIMEAEGEMTELQKRIEGLKRRRHSQQ